MVEELTPSQRSLMEMMRTHQFGRIENLVVRGGEPILNSDTKVVRVARLGGERERAKPSAPSNEFDLKKQVCDLLDELDRLQDGTVIRLEFRHDTRFCSKLLLNDRFLLDDVNLAAYLRQPQSSCSKKQGPESASHYADEANAAIG